MHLPAALLALVACAVSSHAATDQQARFAALAAKRSGVIPLNSKLFDDITSTPRNYSVSIALTALPGQYKCEPCR
jgi:oligosaccharyltransferase complex subunit gamma